MTTSRLVTGRFEIREPVVSSHDSCAKVAYSRAERSCFLRRVGRASLIPMFTAYFDAGGAPDSTAIFTVADFVGQNQQWIEFDRNWKEVLERFNAPPLHMRHFAHSIEEFADRKGNESKAFLKL